MNRKIEKLNENPRSIRRSEGLHEVPSLWFEIISCKVRLKVSSNHYEILSRSRNLCSIRSKNEFKDETKGLRLQIHMMNLTFNEKLNDENERKWKEFIESPRRNDCKESGSEGMQNWEPRENEGNVKKDYWGKRFKELNKSEFKGCLKKKLSDPKSMISIWKV